MKLAPPAILNSHFFRFQDLCLSKNLDDCERRKLGSSFPLTTRNDVSCDRHHGICLMFLASCRSSVFDCLCCVFPNGRLFYSSQVCAANILGKFLIVYRYSVLKSNRDLLGYLFSWLFCSRDIFARSMSPGCSPSLFWNWHDWNLHAFEIKHPQTQIQSLFLPDESF